MRRHILEGLWGVRISPNNLEDADASDPDLLAYEFGLSVPRCKMMLGMTGTLNWVSLPNS